LPLGVNLSITSGSKRDSWLLKIPTAFQAVTREARDLREGATWTDWISNGSAIAAETFMNNAG